MQEITLTRLERELESEVDRALERHETLRVKLEEGRSFVIVGEDDWRGIEETLFLKGIPGLVESLHEAAREPIEEGTRLAPSGAQPCDRP